MVFQCLDPPSGAVLGDKKGGVNWDDITTTVEFSVKDQSEWNWFLMKTPFPLKR